MPSQNELDELAAKLGLSVPNPRGPFYGNISQSELPPSAQGLGDRVRRREARKVIDISTNGQGVAAVRVRVPILGSTFEIRVDARDFEAFVQNPELARQVMERKFGEVRQMTDAVTQNMTPLQKAAVLASIQSGGSPNPVAGGLGAASDIEMYMNDPDSRTLGNYLWSGLAAAGDFGPFAAMAMIPPASVRRAITNVPENTMKKYYHVAPSDHVGDLESLYTQYGNDAYEMYAERWPEAGDLGNYHAHYVHLYDDIDEAKLHPGSGKIYEIDPQALLDNSIDVKIDRLEYPHPMVEGSIPSSLLRVIPAEPAAAGRPDRVDDVLKRLAGRNIVDYRLADAEDVEMGFQEGSVILDKIYVDPQNRGQGIGSELLKATIMDIRDKYPGREISLLAEPLDDGIDLSSLVEFYEKNGFDIGNYVDGMSGVPMSMSAQSVKGY